MSGPEHDYEYDGYLRVGGAAPDRDAESQPASTNDQAPSLSGSVYEAIPDVPVPPPVAGRGTTPKATTKPGPESAYVVPWSATAGQDGGDASGFGFGSSETDAGKGAPATPSRVHLLGHGAGAGPVKANGIPQPAAQLVATRPPHHPSRRVVDVVLLAVSFAALAVAIAALANSRSGSDPSLDPGLVSSLRAEVAVLRSATMFNRLLDRDGTVGEFASLALTSMGTPIISYADRTNGNLQLAICRDKACSSAMLRTLDNTGDAGLFSAMALTSRGFPVVSYFESISGDLRLAICNDMTCSGASLRTLDKTRNRDGTSSVALTGQDAPVISYHDSANDVLKLAVCNDQTCGSFTVQVVDNTGGGKFNSVAITSSGIPIIAYSDQGNLKLAVCRNLACDNPALLTVDSRSAGGKHVGDYNSLALTSQDAPVIAYHDATTNNAILLVCKDLTCTGVQPQVVDSVGSVGWHTSLVLTSQDVPRIAYYDSTNGDLKLAVCNDASCSSSTLRVVDSNGNVGSYASIVLTSQDIPVIAYQDQSNADLRLAVCNDETCSGS